jgi:anthranilate phosphoribosyltransferase
MASAHLQIAEDVGLKRVKPRRFAAACDRNAGARRAQQEGPYRDVAIMNAAAGLIVAGRAHDLAQGVALATKAVDSAGAEGRLDRLIAVSNA